MLFTHLSTPLYTSQDAEERERGREIRTNFRTAKRETTRGRQRYGNRRKELDMRTPTREKEEEKQRADEAKRAYDANDLRSRTNFAGARERDLDMPIY